MDFRGHADNPSSASLFDFCRYQFVCEKQAHRCKWTLRTRRSQHLGESRLCVAQGAVELANNGSIIFKLFNKDDHFQRLVP